MNRKQFPFSPQPKEVPAPPTKPEVGEDIIPESPPMPTEEPDIIPEEDPYETPPPEMPPPGEGP